MIAYALIIGVILFLAFLGLYYEHKEKQILKRCVIGSKWQTKKEFADIAFDSFVIKNMYDSVYDGVEFEVEYSDGDIGFVMFDTLKSEYEEVVE